MSTTVLLVLSAWLTGIASVAMAGDSITLDASTIPVEDHHYAIQNAVNTYKNVNLIGEFDIGDNTVLIKKSTTVNGGDVDDTVVNGFGAATGTELTTTMMPVFLINDPSAKVTIKHLDIRGGAGFSVLIASCRGATITDNRISSVNAWRREQNKILVRGVNVDPFFMDAPPADTTGDYVIARNKIELTYYSALRTIPIIFYDTPVDSITIRDNELKSVGMGIGIDGNNGAPTLIHGNKIYSEETSIWLMDGWYYPNDNIIVSDNDINLNYNQLGAFEAGAGILVRGSSGFEFANNKVKGQGIYGIRLRDGAKGHSFWLDEDDLEDFRASEAHISLDSDTIANTFYLDDDDALEDLIIVDLGTDNVFLIDDDEDDDGDDDHHRTGRGEARGR